MRLEKIPKGVSIEIGEDQRLNLGTLNRRKLGVTGETNNRKPGRKAIEIEGKSRENVVMEAKQRKFQGRGSDSCLS